jgi:hypothetical protein
VARRIQRVLRSAQRASVRTVGDERVTRGRTWGVVRSIR